MSNIELMSPQMVTEMRAACQLAAETLVMISRHLRVGMTTEAINALVHEFTLQRGARPATLGYRGFPKSCCVSRNEVICHGIPGAERLEDGDIVNVDITSVLPAKDGYFGDNSATFYIGEPSAEARHVVEVARQSLEVGIAQVRDGARLGDIGAAIQEFAEGEGCAVVRDYVGHGVGRRFHMPPNVPHFGKKGSGPRLRAGMVFTIEPMINLGAYETELLDDQWTVVTRDRSLSAQFEHTVLVTRTGCEVLTRRAEPLHLSEDKPWARLGRLSSPAMF
jgi:methionyl aminopeptidase